MDKKDQLAEAPTTAPDFSSWSCPLPLAYSLYTKTPQRARNGLP